jgi:predicted PurR-regulated permease PerM
MADPTEAAPSDVTAAVVDDGARAVRVAIEPPPWRWIWGLLLSVVVVVFAAWATLNTIRRLRDLLVWIFVALFASFAIEPAVDFLQRHGWRRGLATAAIIFGLIISAILMVALMIPLIVDQVRGLISAGPDIIAHVDVFTRKWFGTAVSYDSIRSQLADANSAVGKFANNIAGNLFGFATSLLGTIFKMLTIGLFTFYLVADGPKFRRTICSFLPQSRQAPILFTWEVAIEKTGAYLYARLLLATVSAIATFLILTVLHIPYPIPLAIWMGLVSQFIPTIGTYIAMALPLLVAVVKDPIDALILLVFFTAYQQAENYFLSPRITAKTMNLHPALAFGCAIAGASIQGIVGAFLAIPFAAIVQAIGSTYIHRHEVMDSELTRTIERGDHSGRERRHHRGSHDEPDAEPSG